MQQHGKRAGSSNTRKETNLRCKLQPVQMHVSAELYLPSPAYRYARLGFFQGPALKDKRDPYTSSNTIIPALVLTVENLQTSTLTSNVSGGLVVITDEAVDYENCCDIQSLYQIEDVQHNLDTFGATNLLIAPSIDGVDVPYKESQLQNKFIFVQAKSKTSTHVQQWCSFHPYWWKLVDLGETYASRLRQAVELGSFNKDTDLGELVHYFCQTMIIDSNHMRHLLDRASPHIFDFEKIQIV